MLYNTVLSNVISQRCDLLWCCLSFDDGMFLPVYLNFVRVKTLQRRLWWTKAKTAPTAMQTQISPKTLAKDRNKTLFFQRQRGALMFVPWQCFGSDRCTSSRVFIFDGKQCLLFYFHLSPSFIAAVYIALHYFFVMSHQAFTKTHNGTLFTLMHAYDITFSF